MKCRSGLLVAMLDGQNWLKVKPVGVTSNPDGVGAQLRLFTTVAGQQVLVGMRHIQSGAGYGRSSPLAAHFGLGRAPASQYSVEVFFPATKKKVVKHGVEPAQRIVVRDDDE